MNEFTTPFQLGTLRVDPDKDQISSADKTLEIQSMAMKVLCYFATNQNQLITRDELREQVWQNATASNHTINNHIYSLRQVLAKLDAQTKYIHTVTGSNGNGYRLLVPVTSMANQAAEKIQPAIAANKSKPLKWYTIATVGLILLMLTMGYLWFNLPSPTKLTVLTTQQGREQSPAVSADGEILIYSNRTNRKDSWDLYAGKIGQPFKSIKVFADGDFKDNFVSLSTSKKRIAFHRFVKGEEGIYVADFDPDNLSASNARRVIPLTRDNLSPAISWMGDDRFFYTAQEAPWAPLRIYLYHLNSGNIEQVTSPALKTFGDYAVMLSPDQTTLAVMRAEGFNGYRLYLYRLADKTLIKTSVSSTDVRLNISFSDNSELVYFVDQQGFLAAYDIDNETVEQISQQQWPGYWPLKTPGREQFVMQQDWGVSSLTTQIVRYANPLHGGDGVGQMIVNNGLSIRSIEGIGQGGLIFASVKPNFQIELWRYAFDESGGNAFKLSQFNEKPHYRYPLSLSWSKGSNKALLSINESCRLVDINTGKDTPLCAAGQQVYAGTFGHGGQSILLAAYRQETAVAMKMGITGYPFDQLKKLTNANMVKQSKNGDFYYRVDPGFDIYHFDGKSQKSEMIIDRHYLNNGFSVNDFVLTENGIYFMDKRPKKRNAVYYYDFATKQTRHLIDSPNEYPNIAISDDEQFIYQIQSVDNDSHLFLLE